MPDTLPSRTEFIPFPTAECNRRLLPSVNGMNSVLQTAKRPIAPISGRRIRLRLLDETDLPQTLVWRNLDHIRIWFTHSDPLTPEMHRAWFEKYRTRDNDFVFIIEALSDDGLARPVGQVSVYDIDWEQGTAEVGRVLVGDPVAERRGYGVEAFHLLCDYALTGLGLRELLGRVLPHNVRSLNLCLRCGFVRQDEVEGLVHMVLHRDDWPPERLRKKSA